MNACNSTTVVVDDSDTTRITYTGDWLTSFNPFEYNNTSHGTTEEGATAKFSFNGTSVAVFGTVAASGGNTTSTYVLDGSILPWFFSANSTSTPLYEQLFYQSPTLQDGEHTLVVTSTGGTPLRIDLISYTTPKNSSSTTTSTPSATVTASTTVPTATTVLAPLPSATISSPSPRSSRVATQKTKVPAAAIAVSSIGALVLLTAAMVLLILWRRKRRGVDHKDEEVRAVPEMFAAVTPFPPPSPPPRTRPVLPMLSELPPPPPPSPRPLPPVLSQASPPPPLSPRQSRPPSYPSLSSPSVSYSTKKIYDDPSFGYQPYDPTNPLPASGSAPMTYDPFSSTPIYLGFPTQVRVEKGTLVVMNPAEYGGGEGGGGALCTDNPIQSAVLRDVPPSYRH